MPKHSHISTYEPSPWWERTNAPWAGTVFKRMNLGGSDEGELRIQRLREEILTLPPGKFGRVSIHRTRLITEGYKGNEGESSVIRRAKAIYHLFSNIPIWLSPHQLIAGSPTAEPHGIEVEPEFSSYWMLRKVKIGTAEIFEFEAIPVRKQGEYVLTKEDKEILKEEILPYWKGKDLEAHFRRECKRSYGCPEKCLSCKYSDVCMPALGAGISHTVQDYASVLKKGLKGIKEEIEETKKQLDLSNPQEVSDFHRILHYEAMITCADAIIVYAHRCADVARELASKEEDKKRKTELLEIARICKKVPEYPAQTWWEALQSWHFLHMGTALAEGGASHCAGRFDQYMYPYLKRDLEKGIITKAKTQELLECLFIKINEREILLDYGGSRAIAPKKSDDRINIGGVDRYGQDCTNELSYMLLEAQAHVHLRDPNLAVRVHKNTPDDLLRKTLEVIRLGGGLPIIINDEVIIPALLSMGVSLGEARNYADIGCQENVTDPNMIEDADTHGHTNAGWFNLVKPVELALFNGCNPRNGKQVGPKTGDPKSFKTMEDFVKAVKRQFEFAIEVNTALNNLIEYCFAEYFPLPYHNLMHPGPRKKGIDMNAGGCKYNWTGAIGVGIATAGDILSAIDHLVYKKSEVDWDELLRALQNDWEGYEKLRKKCIEAPKYGEDNDQADKWVQKIANIFFDAYESHRTSRGGKFICGFFSLSFYVTLGEKTGATPDGRKRGEELSDAISPSQYAKPLGPTAAHNSASKIDTLRTLNGITFNQRFGTDTLISERALTKWADLVRTYLEQGGQQVQYSVVSADALKDAQKNPERNRDLIVRVGGYSAFFVDLPKEIQDSFIRRVEQSIH